jgi:UDP-N-acetylmuramyl tripeptide synthase
MPNIEYFPYMGPNRRSDKPVVEVTLEFSPDEQFEFPGKSSEIRQILIDAGILTPEDIFPEQPLPDEYGAWFASLLVQTALLFQRKTGHRVNFIEVVPTAEKNRYLALLEHEHCDVGMTAVKLAFELLSGQRKLLAEPFRMFHIFAQERLLPVETEAIINAAQGRDIPCMQLERQPYKREDFDALTGGKCIKRNSLLMLGHGAHQHVLDGAYCLDKTEKFKYQPGSGQASEAALPNDGLDEYAQQLLDWLFQDESPVRTPIIAITGTNGKTTTTRMITHIMKVAGRKPGMVCTDGIFLDGRQTVEVDKSSRTGHLQVLGSTEVDVAVLETHHGGILQRGFAFRHCDIAICLNVTEDHLGSLGIDTVEQMADVKQALLERASQAAILNADDPLCLNMLDALNAEKICLVSVKNKLESLSTHENGRNTCFCVLEEIKDREWIVIHDQSERLPVLPVKQIQATFNGTARFNISNAMHAIAAAYLAGVGIENIKIAMSSFSSDYKSTPGRMNLFEELPFKIIMDFAHNPDGVSQVCQFVDQQHVAGRKVVAFAGTPDRADETIRSIGQSLAGHFDFYFCKEHVSSDGSERRKVAHLLQQGLIRAGVTESQTTLASNGKDVIFEIFDSCKTGDLLVMLMGHVEKHQLPTYIREYAELQKKV